MLNQNSISLQYLQIFNIYFLQVFLKVDSVTSLSYESAELNIDHIN